MCLLVFYINPNPKPDEFTFILINVRDEIYDRPTSKASFWDSNPDVIGGMDMEPGKEGGTWLAMNKNGKISVLLNILQQDKDILPNKKGRGFLAVNFANNEDDSTHYMSDVIANKDDYNGFLVVAIDLRSSQRPNMAYFSNAISEKTNSHFVLEPGVHAFGNSVTPDNPWPKVQKAKEKFTQIVNTHRMASSRESLVSELFHLLKDPTCHGVDKNMEIQGKGKSKYFLKKLSAIFVEVPESNYGSRCHTIILVDSHGSVDYYERSRKETSAPQSAEDWDDSHYYFKLNYQK